MHRGFIKIWRKFEDNPWFNKPKYLALWVHLLFLATHKPIRKIFKGKEIMLKPGQFITGRKFLSVDSGIPETTIERILKTFQNEHQIEQQTSNTNRLITILNWNQYQKRGQQSGQRVDNEWTTSGQRVDTNKNDKNYKNYKNIKAQFDFESVWQKYPSGKKQGKDEALGYFNVTIKTDEDYRNINKAIDNYKKQLENNIIKPKFVKKGGNWFKEWKDWIEWEDVEIKPKNPWIKEE